jgi:nicotinate-nucleotide adenylyltransferase
MRVGIFGGTFDPPHVGHLVLAMEAQSQLKLERFLWVLTGDPPHKINNKITAVEHRLEMVKAAISADLSFELSRVEIDRPGPHYAADTMVLLNEQMPNDELVYLIGGDSLHDLPTWYKPQLLIESCGIMGVMRRVGDHIAWEKMEQSLPGLRKKVQFIETPIIEISSTEIRQRITDGRPYRYFLLPEVYQIIKNRQLYRG